MLFTCIKSWFFRNHLANFHQISHWSFCWNAIDSLFKWSCSIDCQARIFFKTKNCSNDDISLVAMIGLEKCCITSACLEWLCHSGERTVARGPLVTIYGHGGQLGQRAATILAILHSPRLRRIHMKFEQNWPRGSREVVWNSEHFSNTNA